MSIPTSLPPSTHSSFSMPPGPPPPPISPTALPPPGYYPTMDAPPHPPPATISARRNSRRNSSPRYDSHLTAPHPRGSYSTQDTFVYPGDDYPPERESRRSHRRDRSRPRASRRHTDYPDTSTTYTGSGDYDYDYNHDRKHGRARSRARDKSLSRGVTDMLRALSLGPRKSERERERERRGLGSRRGHGSGDTHAAYYADSYLGGVGGGKYSPRSGSSSRRNKSRSRSGRHGSARSARSSRSSSYTSSSGWSSDESGGCEGGRGDKRLSGQKRAALVGATVGMKVLRRVARHKGWKKTVPTAAGMLFGGVTGKELRKFLHEPEERKRRRKDYY